MYQASLFNEEAAKSGSSKLQPGIHTNVTLLGIEEGEDYFDVLFDKDGLRANTRLWEPKGDYPKAGETEEDAKERERRSKIDYVVSIMNFVVGLEVANKVQASSYDEFMRKAAAVVNNKASQKKFNIKVNRDAKGFPKMPAYRGGVELYVAGEPSALKFSVKELAALETPVDTSKASAKDLPY